MQQRDCKCGCGKQKCARRKLFEHQLLYNNKSFATTNDLQQLNFCNKNSLTTTTFLQQKLVYNNNILQPQPFNNNRFLQQQICNIKDFDSNNNFLTTTNCIQQKPFLHQQQFYNKNFLAITARVCGHFGGAHCAVTLLCCLECLFSSNKNFVPTLFDPLGLLFFAFVSLFVFLKVRLSGSSDKYSLH